MKLSVITISAMLLVQTQAVAQSKTPTNPKPVKQKSKTNQPSKPQKEKTAIAKDSVKPVNKNPNHYYCPPCGMG